MYRSSLFLLFLISLVACQDKPDANHERTTLDRQAVADAMEAVLNSSCLNNWYPRAIDAEFGGFYSDFDADWNLSGPQYKMIVTQARNVWSLSVAAEFYPDRPYLDYAAHGFKWLQGTMWDATHGGFYQMVDQQGVPVRDDPQYEIIKTAYGNAFGIYGLAAYHRASGDEAALALAKEAFLWLEEHSHDPELGGYFQFLLEDGTPLKEGHTAPPKDQNSSIHLLEAFTELYMVWPDDLVRQRVEEMLLLIRDTITTDKGYLTLFSKADWTPVSYRDSSDSVREEHHHLDHVSFGHDIETAYLLMEASHVIHHEEDATTARKAKHMVDHTMEHGWDAVTGGIFDGGYYFQEDGPMTIIDSSKAWWAQVEAMNTLLIMHDMYPADPRPYGDWFLQQWQHVQDYLIDHERGGFYIRSIDEDPDAVQSRKGSIWKGNYHNLRSLVNCIRRLREQ